jgi:hypothetical protein
MGPMIRVLLAPLLVAVLSPDSAATPVDSLLVHHAETMGMSRQELGPECWHVVEEIQGLGLSGRAETWAQPPASVRTRLEIGPLAMESWFDGEEGWISDRNGASRKAAGGELDGMLVQALFSTGSWLLEKPPVPLSFRILETESTDSTVTLLCEPFMEEPLRIELHRETLVPVSTRFDSAEGEQVHTFLEWGWREGVLVPLRSRLDLAGLLTLDSRVTEIERIDPRPAEFFRPRELEPSLPDDVQFGAPVVPAALLEDGLHLTIEGQVEDGEGNEVSVVLLVDTGAGANFLDAGAARRLGMASEGEIPTLGVGGHAESSFVTVNALRIGEVEVRDQSWMASDFSAIRSWFDNPPSAVLGYDFLSRTVLEVDYSNRMLRFHDPARFAPPEGAVALELRMDANIPSVEVLIEGKPGWLHVDTGSNGALDLTQPFVERHGLLQDRETSPGGGLHGVGGTARSRSGEVESLQLGDLVLENVATGFNESESGIFSRDDIAGILGAQLLSRFTCWFDYPGRTLWLVER